MKIFNFMKFYLFLTHLKLWDLRHTRQEIFINSFGDLVRSESGKQKGKCSCFAASLRHNFFAADFDHDLVVRKYSPEGKGPSLVDKSYPVRNVENKRSHIEKLVIIILSFLFLGRD